MYRKGQTAVEYLTTYGWMLFVFAVVSGGIMTSGIGSSCTEEMTGLSTGALQVADFGLNTEGQLQLLLSNSDSERLEQEIKEVRVVDETSGNQLVLESSRTLALGEKTELSLDNFSHSEGCRELELVVKYDRGDVLKNQELSGTIDGQIKLDRSYTDVEETASYQVSITDTNSPVDAGETLNVEYGIENTGSAEGETGVDFYFDGVLEDSSTETVSPGETVTGSFSKDTSGLDGNYPVKVEVEGDEDSTTVEVSGDEETSPSEPSQTENYSLGVNVSTTAQVDVYSDGALEESREVDDFSFFELSPGNYTVNASSPDYRDASEKVELDSDRNVTLVLQQYPPEVYEFDVVDNSECRGWMCAIGGGNGPAEYEVSWNVSDRYGELQSVSILFNGAEEFTGKSGTGTYSEGGGYGDEYTIRLEADYTGETLCREVTDTADSDDPSGSEYSVC